MRVPMRRALIRGGRCLVLALGLGILALLASHVQILAHSADGHPAKIHEGTCDALGRAGIR